MEITFDLLPAAAGEIIERLDNIEKLLLVKAQQPEPAAADYLTRQQVCEKLHVSLPTVHAWMKQGRLHPYHIGGRTLFRSDEVREAVRAVDYTTALEGKKKGGSR